MILLLWLVAIGAAAYTHRPVETEEVAILIGITLAWGVVQISEGLDDVRKALERRPKP